MKRIILGIIFSILLFSFSSAAAWNYTMESNIKAIYTFEEASGNLIDRWDGNNNGSASGSPTYQQTGKNNYAIDFEEGTPDFFTIGDHEDLRSGSITVSLWYKQESNPAANRRLWASGDQDVAGSYSVYELSTDKFGCIGMNDAGASFNADGTTTITTGTWAMVTAVFNTVSKTCKIYVNGSLEATSSAAAGTVSLANTGSKYVGRDGNAAVQPADGLIDELYVWKEAKTDTFISSLYDGGTGTFYTAGVAYPTNLTLNTPTNNTYGTSKFFNFTYQNTSTVKNVTLYIWNSSGSLTTYSNTSGIAIQNITPSSLGVGQYSWNVYACDDSCMFASNGNFTYYYGVSNTFVESYNSTVYETTTESIYINVSYAPEVTSIAGTLYYNGTAYPVTPTLSGGVATFSKNIEISTISSSMNRSFYWNFIPTDGNGSLNLNSSTNNQMVKRITLGLCNSTLSDKYMNFTFKNETLSQERVTASFSSTWFYYITLSSMVRNTTITNLTENQEVDICFDGGNRTIQASPTATYYNSYSLQRSYAPGYLTLTNTITSATLFLLPTSTGSYVSFQTINTADQVISGVAINITHATYGLIEAKNTDDSGIATFFLNPINTYTVCAYKTGYSTVCNSITPTQTTYTINMGGGTDTNETLNFNQGMSYLVKPTDYELLNNTYYNFNFTVNSSYWALDEFGFYIYNSSGSILASNSSTDSAGGFIGVNLSTGTNTKLTGNFFWRVGGNYTNFTRSWVIHSQSDWSIFKAFDRFSDYIGNETDSDGLFGLTNRSGGRNFGLYLIIFLIVFSATGILSYKFGLTSPASILLVAFGFIFMFDMLNLLPRPDNGFPIVTTLFGLILLGAFLKEAYSG